MSYQYKQGKIIQKKIQLILEKKNLTRKLKLECIKLKYFNCQILSECKICVKGYKYTLYKAFK